jgi:predicted amidohydrolase
MFVPLVEEAARQKADLVVLGECITYIGLGLSYADVAEPVPGPSTEFFGELAKKHDLYVVVPVFEREAGAIYNTAALVGPEGFLGKYRKVCLPRGEYDGGITAGSEYPVFHTRFGTVGMMICWDVHCPEVARNLAENGAEVIALPIWGGNPKLAAARAIENQVYLVTSTYTTDESWMKTGIWDLDGNLAARAKEWGTVAVCEVDLDRQHFGFGNIGDFRSRIPREGPVD